MGDPGHADEDGHTHSIGRRKNSTTIKNGENALLEESENVSSANYSTKETTACELEGATEVETPLDSEHV